MQVLERDRETKRQRETQKDRKYQKPTKGFSAVLGYTWKKGKCARMEHYTEGELTFLYDICCVSEDSEYSLYCEFFDAFIGEDQICFSQLENYIVQRGNPFNIENYCMQNLAVGSQDDEEAPKFQ